MRAHACNELMLTATGSDPTHFLCCKCLLIFLCSEAAATYTPPGGGAPVQIGFPMAEAVWRTNHGYDPTIRKHYEWSQAPSSWSMQRYMFIHDALTTYQQENTTIGNHGDESPWQPVDLLMPHSFLHRLASGHQHHSHRWR